MNDIIPIGLREQADVRDSLARGRACAQAPAVPRLGWVPVGRRAERVLLLASWDASDPDELAAAAAAWQQASAYAITVVNVEAELGGFTPHSGLLHRFDAIVVCGAAASAKLVHACRMIFAGPILQLVLSGAAAATRHGTALAVDGRLTWEEGEGSPAQRADSTMEVRLRSRDAMRRPQESAGKAARNVLLLVPHKPKQDPRLAWVAHGAPEPLLVHQLGVHAPGEGGLASVRDARGGLVQSVPMASYAPGEAAEWAAWAEGHAGAAVAIEQLLWMERALQLPQQTYVQVLGAWSSEPRAVALRYVLQYVLDVTSSLVRYASAMRNVDAIMAADVPALPAAFLLAALFRVPVVFDAHEYWPQADLGAADFEMQFWRDMERRLLAHTELRMTVSPGLAEVMEREYGVPFLVVPNAEPLHSVKAGAEAAPAPPCVFLFQGGFARGRGVELLISAWARVTRNAHLYLRGPHSEFRDGLIAQARRTGLLGQRIFFPEPVDETELVQAASQAHVGLVPYEPHGTNHRHCCPNKISQYLAAGLPILANDTTFVREVITGSGAGLVVDFRDQDALVAAVNRMAMDPQLRRQQATKARAHFTERFHWEALSAVFYRDLLRLVGAGPREVLQVYGRDASAMLQVPGRDADAWDSRPRGQVADARAVAEPMMGARSGALRSIWRHMPEPVRRFVRPTIWRLRARLHRF